MERESVNHLCIPIAQKSHWYKTFSSQKVGKIQPRESFETWLRTWEGAFLDPLSRIIGIYVRWCHRHVSRFFFFFSWKIRIIRMGPFYEGDHHHQYHDHGFWFIYRNKTLCHHIQSGLRVLFLTLSARRMTQRLMKFSFFPEDNSTTSRPCLDIYSNGPWQNI